MGTLRCVSARSNASFRFVTSLRPCIEPISTKSGLKIQTTVMHMQVRTSMSYTHNCRQSKKTRLYATHGKFRVRTLLHIIRRYVSDHVFSADHITKSNSEVNCSEQGDNHPCCDDFTRASTLLKRSNNSHGACFTSRQSTKAKNRY